MSVRRLSLCLLAAAACGVDSRTQPDEAAQLAATRLEATNVVLTLAERVLPGGTTTVRVEATLSGVPRRETVSLAFTGDASAWSADLPMTGKTGDRYTFSRALTAPAVIGQHQLAWAFQLSNGTRFGAAGGDLEVTCSDGEFCNGEERWTKTGCKAGSPPCDDGVACTTDTCDSALRTCFYRPQGGGCDTCAEKNCNPKCGRNQECGDDGCGGRCTSSATDAAGTCLGGEFCVDGTCQAVSAAGTCANPLPLFGAAGATVPSAGVTTTVTGDTSTGLDLLAVSCGSAGIKELVYRFDVPVSMGFEIRMLSTTGDANALDTVLAIHRDDCFTQAGGASFCSDDASPPGGLGSRVEGLLPAGSYRLIGTGYSSSQVGPFQLQLKFVPSCIPTCDGKFCGPDGCGGECGACTAGQECSAAGRCFTAPCTPSCNGRQCGDDGCGGSCGTCGAGELCAGEDGRCVSTSGCDHLLPSCGNCGPKSYCGSDCQCHPVGETLIDLLPAPADWLLPTVEFEWRSFQGTSCGIAEGCVPGPGRYLLMRFATDILNQGLAGFKPGDPASQPELFEYHDCHQHYHFQGFANYALVSLDGKQLMAGRKLSYCMEDSVQYLQGPNIPCEPESTCADQGIQAGWADRYPNTLDCQWLVLRGTEASATDVPLGRWYYHETCTNMGRTFHEHTFDNNCVRIPVYLPDVPDNGSPVRYSDIVPPPMP